MDDDNNIRPPDKTYKETLVNTIYNIDDDIDIELKLAIEQSIKEYHNKLKKEQDEKLKEQEEKLKKLMNKKNIQNERKKKLGNIYEKMLLIKYHNKDNISNTFILLLSIINKYINCHCDDYEVDIEIYNNILYELSQIRIKNDELNEIKKILNIIN